MFLVCPQCHWSVCECSAKWTPPVPPFEIDRKYRGPELIARGAVVSRGMVYVLIPAPTPTTVDVFYGFAPTPLGRFVCFSFGRRFVGEHDRWDSLPDKTPLIDLLLVS